MTPWDPIIREIPGGGLPVSRPIRIFTLPWGAVGDAEASWWAHLLASLWGLRTVYHRLADPRQAVRTGKACDLVLEAVKRLYHAEADRIQREAVMAASKEITAWDWRIDPLALETGWWAQAARCAHVLAQVYAHHAGGEDLRAILAADVLKRVQERVESALPETVARELLAEAMAPVWPVSRASALWPGTTEDPTPHPAPILETEG